MIGGPAKYVPESALTNDLERAFFEAAQAGAYRLWFMIENHGEECPRCGNTGDSGVSCEEDCDLGQMMDAYWAMMEAKA